MKKSGLLASFVISLVLALNFISAKWTFTSMLQDWNTMGVFKYMLPFLLVFALVYGLLTKSQLLGDNNGVNAILAVAIGLLSLYGDVLPNFAEVAIPNLGMGLIVLLASILLMGLLFSAKKDEGISWLKYVFFGVGALAFLFFLGGSFSGNNSVGNIWDDYGPAILTVLILGGLIALAVKGKGKGDSS